MIIHLAMDQDNSSHSSSIIREDTSQVTQHSHHLTVTRAVEVVVEVVVVVVSIQGISRALVGDMDSSLVAMEDNRVVTATKAMEVCTYKV
jgi:hypothetical protein